MSTKIVSSNDFDEKNLSFSQAYENINNDTIHSYITYNKKPFVIKSNKAKIVYITQTASTVVYYVKIDNAFQQLLNILNKLVYLYIINNFNLNSYTFDYNVKTLANYNPLTNEYIIPVELSNTNIVSIYDTSNNIVQPENLTNNSEVVLLYRINSLVCQAEQFSLNTTLLQILKYNPKAKQVENVQVKHCLLEDVTDTSDFDDDYCSE